MTVQKSCSPLSAARRSAPLRTSEEDASQAAPSPAPRISSIWIGGGPDGRYDYTMTPYLLLYHDTESPK